MYLSFKIDGDELDRRMGGGLYVGQIVTILGASGEGKTLLSIRLAYGVIKNGSNICYVSSQFPVREFISEAETLGYGMFNEILSDKASFITSVFILRKNKRADLDDLLSLDKVKEKQVLIIDSLSPAMFKDFDISSFLERLRKFSEGRIVIITMNPDELDAKAMSKVNQLSTTIIHMRSKDLAGERKHYIDLMKFPMAMKNFQQSIPFRIEPKRGLVVEISSVS
ncbi:MAG: flagellar accessory protein FlaH [Candidatus Thermoplasmatota archaeon]|jgi:flagellar protein FlaH|nr:flagellar accessory protein FlaH [Candidatus Thermoplasmatota archaeon]